MAIPDVRRSYDLVAADYAAALAAELRHKPLDRALLNAFAELTAGGRVADLGCGPGHVATYLADRGASVVGMDLSPAMCSSVRVPACAGDLTALPLRSDTVTGLVCLYAVIHLDRAGRAMAYAEFARVLRRGGHALIAFHTSDNEIEAGGAKRLTSWWNHDVDLTFHFLDPAEEVALLTDAGLVLVAQLDRAPHADVEHPSQRSYLLATCG